MSHDHVRGEQDNKNLKMVCKCYEVDVAAEEDERDDHCGCKKCKPKRKHHHHHRNRRRGYRRRNNHRR
ncbi:hypothetical protein KQI49_13820 [Virgibacillus sp. MSJ-26]|uniref:hypothetical protein n=1 Tax=Virgibacillus sp. MSJ-26 TaxID=2841522 RepID=UPI001C0F7987|nr:hypothetical protein [Virgibacillus sp. MSJ-26]MBU5467903.1 hypothetical protein [Virgibacillus sp. MSJ-26]